MAYFPEKQIQPYFGNLHKLQVELEVNSQILHLLTYPRGLPEGSQKEDLGKHVHPGRNLGEQVLSGAVGCLETGHLDRRL